MSCIRLRWPPGCRPRIRGLCPLPGRHRPRRRRRPPGQPAARPRPSPRHRQPRHRRPCLDPCRARRRSGRARPRPPRPARPRRRRPGRPRAGRHLPPGRRRGHGHGNGHAAEILVIGDTDIQDHLTSDEHQTARCRLASQADSWRRGQGARHHAWPLGLPGHRASTGPSGARNGPTRDRGWLVNLLPGSGMSASVSPEIARACELPGLARVLGSRLRRADWDRRSKRSAKRWRWRRSACTRPRPPRGTDPPS